MVRPLAFAAVLFALLGACTAGVSSAAPAPDPASSDSAIFERWHAHFRHLASDEMRGRQTGSPEHRKAAEYVAGQFKALGLRPGAGDGYLQPVPFVARRVREEDCSLELVFPDRTEKLEFGRDAILQMSIDAAERLEAPAVFVGYGISVPEQGYDDLARADLRGKIAVFIQGGPRSVTEPRRSHAQSSAERWARLRDAGAIGIIQIRNPHHSDLPWEHAAAERFAPGMGLADAELDERRGQQFGASLNPARAEALFAGAPHRFEELLALADSGAALPVFPLSPVVRARVHFDRTVRQSDNVVAVLPGRDAALAGQSVVLTGHLDHLGIATPVAGDSICNGAMDNASGISALIEIARALQREPEAPARTVVFVCVTGEEKGLLGSYYYSQRPTVPKESIVANVNVDMVLPIVPFDHVVIHGVDESDLGEQARRIAGESNIEVLPDPRPERNLFIRSDQFNFIRSGIPAVAFSAAGVPGSPADSLLRAWIRERYHKPADNPDQPFDRRAPVDLIRYVTRLTAAAANAPRRPEWKASSFFRRYAAPTQ